jgi:hypothetical protein
MFTPYEVKIELDEWEVAVVRFFARSVEMGGRSEVRLSESRLAELAIDQYAGQAGEAALSKYLTGSISLYAETRRLKKRDPTKGDGGVDLLGYRVDVKCSVARYIHRRDYHLWVRPAEWHPGWVYVLALVREDELGAIYLLGWKRAEALREDSEGRMASRALALWSLPHDPTPERIASLGWAL